MGSVARSFSPLPLPYSAFQQRGTERDRNSYRTYLIWGNIFDDSSRQIILKKILRGEMVFLNTFL